MALVNLSQTLHIQVLVPPSYDNYDNDTKKQLSTFEHGTLVVSATVLADTRSRFFSFFSNETLSSKSLWYLEGVCLATCARLLTMDHECLLLFFCSTVAVRLSNANFVTSLGEWREQHFICDGARHAARVWERWT
jgi:hypothetical protein